jgi:RecQ mediated genome instability protein
MRLDEVNEVKESKTFQMKKRRCFKMVFSDGVNTIEAMELRPIPCLNTKLEPGTKMLISGPVKVSNRIILLEPQNIQILGGNVEELLIENAYENVLLKLLRRPITTTPIKDYIEEKFEAENNRPKPIAANITKTSQVTNNRPPPPSAPININRPANPQMDEEMKQLSIDDNEIDLDFLEQIEAAEREFQRKEEEKQKMLKTPAVVVAPKQNHINLIDSTNEDNFSETFLNRLEDEIMQEEEVTVMNTVPSKSNQTSWEDSTMPSTSNSVKSSELSTSTSAWSAYGQNSNNQKSSTKPKLVPAAKSTLTNPWNPPSSHSRASSPTLQKQSKLTLTNPWKKMEQSMEAKKISPKTEAKKSSFFDAFYAKNSENPPSPPPPPVPEKKIPMTKELMKPIGSIAGNDNNEILTENAKRKSGDAILSPIQKPKTPRIADKKYVF